MTPPKQPVDDKSASIEGTFDPVLLKNEELLRAMLESTADGILVIGKDGKAVYANHRFSEMWRIPKAVLDTKDDETLIAFVLDQLQDPEAFITKVRHLYGSMETDFDTLEFKDNRVFERFSRPLLQNGKVAGRVWSFRDITERKQTEEDLCRAKEFTDTALDSQLDTFFLFELASGKAIRWNRAFRDITGYTDEEIARMPAPASYYSPEDLERAAAAIQKIMEGGAEAIEMELICKDGRKVPTEYRASAINDDNGEPMYLVSIGRDVTGRKKAEADLSEANDIINRSPAVAFLWKNEEGWPVEFVSENVKKLFGYSAQEFMERKISFDEMIHSDDLERVLEEVTRYSKKEGLQSFAHEPYRIITKGGDIKWIDDNTYVRSDPQGIITHYEGIVYDITDRKLAEEALKESEQKYRGIFDSTTDSLLVFDMKGNITEANLQACKMYGYKYEELIKLTGKDIVHPDHHHIFENFERDVSTTGEFHTESVDVHKNGTFIDVEVKGTKFNFKGEPHLLAVLRDITERKRAEKALRESEENLRTTLNSIGDAVISTDIKGKITGMNPVAQTLTGWKSDEAEGKPLAKVFNIINAQTREKIVNPAKQVLKNGEIVGLANHILLIAKDGAEYQIADSGAPILNSKGNITGVVLVFRDVTEEYKMRQTLKESEERFRKLSNLTSEGILIHENGIVIDFNDSILSMTGYTREELIGANVFDKFITPEYQAIVRERILKNITSPYEITVKTKDGTSLPVEVQARNTMDGEKITRVVAVRDITERRKNQAALEESELRYRLLATNTLDMIWTTDLEFNITYVNNAVFNFLGYTPEEFLGLNPVSFTTPEGMLTIQKAAETLITRYKEGDVAQNKFESQHIQKDGTIIDVELTANLLIDNAGELIGFQGRSIDITERKAAEGELRRLSTAMEQIPAAVGITDLKGDLVYVNPKFTQMTGYASEELIGNNPRVLKSGDTPDEEYHDLWDTIMDKGTWKGEFHNRHKNGSLYWESAQISPIFDEKGNITHYIKVAEDITKRKKIEESLRESEEKFSKAFHSNPAIAGLSDLESGEYIEVNQTFCDILGFTPEEVIGGNPTDLLHIDMRWEKDTLAKLKEQGIIRDVEADIRAKNGTRVTVLVSAEIVEINNRKYNFTTAIDITKRKQAEKALREREQLYRTLIHTTSEGYLRVDQDLITIDVNDSLCKMLGYSRQELVDRHLFDFFDEDNLGIIKEQTAKISSTKYRSYEISIRNKSGENIPINISATTLKDLNGKITGSFGLITDMTNQKELTEKLLLANRELKDSQRATLNILEDLSAENRERKIAEEEKEVEMNRAEFYLDLMSHDITNIHQGIYSWIQLAMYTGKDKENVELDLKVGENLVNRSIALVKNVQLLSGLKRMDLIFHPFELGASIKKTISGVENIFVNKDVTINYEPPSEDIVIQAELLIEQLFLNLIHNGVKFQHGDKAVIYIDLSASEKDGTVRFEISDHGPGIPDEMKKNLFDRFKRKDMKFHAGIGLSLVKELVDRYNGNIKVLDRIEGDHTKGARFVVTFPLGDGALDSTLEA